MCRTYGAHELLRLGVLQQVAGGTGPQRGKQLVVVEEARQHDHPCGGHALAPPPSSSAWPGGFAGRIVICRASAWRIAFCSASCAIRSTSWAGGGSPSTSSTILTGWKR